jgi:hypothetical protein
LEPSGRPFLRLLSCCNLAHAVMSALCGQQNTLTHLTQPLTATHGNHSHPANDTKPAACTSQQPHTCPPSSFAASPADSSHCSPTPAHKRGALSVHHCKRAAAASATAAVCLLSIGLKRAQQSKLFAFAPAPYCMLKQASRAHAAAISCCGHTAILTPHTPSLRHTKAEALMCA